MKTKIFFSNKIKWYSNAFATYFLEAATLATFGFNSRGNLYTARPDGAYEYLNHDGKGYLAVEFI